MRFNLQKDNPKEELIDKLVDLQGTIKYHYVDAKSIQYCDDRSSTILEVSQVSPPDADGWVEWEFRFIEDNSIYIFKENINNREK